MILCVSFVWPAYVTGLRRAITSSVVRADDRCARKQLLVILDTSGKEHRRQGGFKRDRDVSHRRIDCVQEIIKC